MVPTGEEPRWRRESRNTQPPGARFRALLTKDSTGHVKSSVRARREKVTDRSHERPDRGCKFGIAVYGLPLQSMAVSVNTLVTSSTLSKKATLMGRGGVHPPGRSRWPGWPGRG